MTYYTNPPSWAKDAIPTERGWVSPKNGELLVSCRLDMSKFKNGEETHEEAVLEIPKVEESSQKNETTEEQSIPVAKKKASAKAPKKSKA